MNHQKGRQIAKLWMLAVLVLLFFLATLVLGRAARVYAEETTWNEYQIIPRGKHLEALYTTPCRHSMDRCTILSCNSSGLNTDNKTIQNAVQIKYGYGARKALSVGNMQQTTDAKYVNSGVNPTIHYRQVNNIGNFAENVMGATLATPYTDAVTGLFGYAYFKIFFSYCETVDMYYYVGAAHNWLGDTTGFVGYNETAEEPYTHYPTLYKIAENNYIILFHNNIKTNVKVDQSAVYGKNVTLNSYSLFTHLTIFSTPQGKHFTGWNTKADGSGRYYADKATIKTESTKEYESFAPAENNGVVNLYAQYENNTYSLIYKGNGAASGFMGDYAVFNAKYADSMRIYDNMSFVRPGYTFAGWNTAADGSGRSFVPTKGGYLTTSKLTDEDNALVTLYAQWIPNTYTIQYQANGGTGTTASQTFSYEDGYGISGWKMQSVTLASNGFAKAGNSFHGWNTRGNGSGENYAAKSAVDTKDLISLASNVGGNYIIKLYAKWGQNTYYVTYHAGVGGIGSDYSTSVLGGTSFRLKKAEDCGFTALSGYVLDGWYGNAAYKGTFYGANALVKDLAGANETVHLYGRWKAKVIYNSNGGSGSPMYGEVYYEQSFLTYTNVYMAPGGYVFDGWNTKADGSGTALLENQLAAGLPAEDGVITLYAQWKRIAYYSLDIDLNGGTYQNHMEDSDFRGYFYGSYNPRIDGWTLAMPYECYQDWRGMRVLEFAELPSGQQFDLQEILCDVTRDGYRIAEIQILQGKLEGYDTVISAAQLSSDRTVIAVTSNTRLAVEWEADAPVPTASPTPPPTQPTISPSPATYLIKYDANYAGGRMLEQIVFCGVRTPLFANEFVKNNYKFTGWNTHADGSGIGYSEREEVLDIGLPGGSIILFAQWKSNIEIGLGRFYTIYAVKVRQGQVVYDDSNPVLDRLSQQVKQNMKANDERFHNGSYIGSWSLQSEKRKVD